MVSGLLVIIYYLLFIAYIRHSTQDSSIRTIMRILLGFNYVIPFMLNSSRGRQEAVPMTLDNFIQEFILNLSEVGVAHPVTQAGQLPVYV